MRLIAGAGLMAAVAAAGMCVTPVAGQVVSGRSEPILFVRAEPDGRERPVGPASAGEAAEVQTAREKRLQRWIRDGHLRPRKRGTFKQNRRRQMAGTYRSRS